MILVLTMFMMNDETQSFRAPPTIITTPLQSPQGSASWRIPQPEQNVLIGTAIAISGGDGLGCGRGRGLLDKGRWMDVGEEIRNAQR
jgi:hypothetical protein